MRKPKQLSREDQEKLDNLEKNLEKELVSLKAKMASKSVENLDDDIKQINGIKVVSKRVEIENPSQLRDLADKF